MYWIPFELFIHCSLIRTEINCYAMGISEKHFIKYTQSVIRKSWMNEVATLSGTVWHSKIVNKPLLSAAVLPHVAKPTPTWRRGSLRESKKEQRAFFFAKTQIASQYVVYSTKMQKNPALTFFSFEFEYLGTWYLTRRPYFIIYIFQYFEWNYRFLARK